MRLGRKASKPGRPRGIARAAADGVSLDGLVREALVCLSRAGGADRFGVWLSSIAKESSGGLAGAFRGDVVDLNGEETPREWMYLAPQVPLSLEQLAAGRTIRQQFSGNSAAPLFGPLAGLLLAEWIPVHRSGRLLGILLGGSRTSHAQFPQEEMESLAAELSLVLELERERHESRCRWVDARLCNHALSELVRGSSAEQVLMEIVRSCTQNAAAGAPGAEFAAIGSLVGGRVPAEEQHGGIEFGWKSGQAEWLSAIELEPMASLWNRAVESKRTVGTETNSTWAPGAISRIVAIPLIAAGAPLGVLAAGLGPNATSLTNLERLELRASCAAAALVELRRKEQEAGRAAEVQAALDAGEGPLVMIGSSGQLARVNRAAREFLGDILDASDSRTLAECFRARDRAAAEAWLRRLAAGGGERRHTHLEAEFRNGKRVRIRVAGPSLDGSVLLALEPLLAPEERTHRGASRELLTLIEWLDQGVVLFDSQNQIRAMNPRFLQLMGLAEREASGIGDLDALAALLAPRMADAEGFAKRWHELAAGAEANPREELQLAEPVSRVLERAARAIRDEAGDLLGRVELYRDLTAHRLWQARLLQTEKLAALGQMVSGVAHELSNPLTSIVGYAQRLLLRNDELGRREEVHRIFAEAERANVILRQMLLSARDAPPERRPISLNHVIQRTVELQKFSLAGEKIRVELDLDPLLPPVIGDVGQLQQILMNLFGNARQAIEPQGDGGVIRVRSLRADGGERVQLEVSDNGPGIPEEIQAQIFDPFFTTKPAGVGTGLGLAIVLGIVREHGGQVYLRSVPGQGATFTVVLPSSSRSMFTAETRANEPTKTGVKPIPPGSAPHSTLNRDGRRRRVLIVEDEPTVARLIADVLLDEGFQVSVAMNGREAQRFSVERFDLIVCDMKMPGFDGAQFYRALARADSGLHDRFLFVTGDVLGSQTQEFLTQSRIPSVAKPFRVEELLGKVHGVIGDAAKTAESVAERKNAATKG